MDALPTELLIHIIEFLQPIDVFVLMRVSSLFHRLAQCTSIWKHRVSIDFPETVVPFSPSTTEYHDIAALPLMLVPVYRWEHEILTEYSLSRQWLGDIPIDIFVSFQDIFEAVELLYHNTHSLPQTLVIVVNLASNYQRVYRHIILAHTIHQNVKTSYIDVPLSIVFNHIDHISIMYG